MTETKMFRGNHRTRVDEKGRLKVPADFKRVIDEKYGTQFYITSLDGKVAQVYPFEDGNGSSRSWRALDSQSTKKKFLERVNSYGQVIEMDGQGRLMIPSLLRDAAQIKGEVAVLGNLTFLEVRNLEVFKSRSKKKSLRLRMRARWTSWAFSGGKFHIHPRAGWTWQHKPCSVLLKEAIEFLAIKRGGLISTPRSAWAATV